MIRCPHCGRPLVSETPLTKKQHAFYKWLYAYVNRNGIAPTYAEMREGMGYTSDATVHEHLTNLETKGFVRRAARGEQRAIVCMVHVDEIGIVAPSVKVRN